MNYINLFTDSKMAKTNNPTRDGGKGHNLIKMKRAGLNVPSGLVIATTACNDYRKLKTVGQRKGFMAALMGEVEAGLEYVFKDAPHRLLSVRSGAKISMAGMMDTLLNVGVGYAGHGIESTPLRKDCEKRFVDMFADVVLGNKNKLTDKQRLTYYNSILNHNDTMLDVISMSIEAVFKSWDNERAKHYRKMYNISDSLGTAVVIQSMVFGNYNDNSGSGVMFTRNPNTGSKTVMGEFLINSQGEDVVAGTATPLPLNDMKKWNKDIHQELLAIGGRLENKNKDMQDIEFTVQDGELFILQTRSGKRSALAEIVIAQDLLKAKKIKKLNERIHKGTLAKLAQPTLPKGFKHKPVAHGIASGGYLAAGKACYSVEQVLACSEPAILVAEETTPEDIKGMEKAVGILTTKGGATSHAAVVARGMNTPCVVGCADIANIVESHSERWVIINGQTGEVYVDVEKFDVDLSTTLPVKAMSGMLEGCVNEDNWVGVSSFDEAIELEDYLYNIVLPVEGLTGEVLLSLATRFNQIVLVSNDRDDSTSRFLGTMESESKNTLRDMDVEVYKSDLENVRFMGELGCQAEFLSSVIGEFKTMSDVMNPEFFGTISPEFIQDVMGSQETFDLINGQVGMNLRVFSDESVLDVLEKWIEIG